MNITTNTTRRGAPAGTLRNVIALVALALAAQACISDPPELLGEAPRANTTVKFDFLHKPLPDIPLPNDIATRYDPTSATLRRVNASMVAHTQFESRLRTLIDQLDGWGVNQPITIPFTGPLDVESILAAHRDPTYGFADDVIYLVDIDPDSAEFGQLKALDVGEGNYPAVLEDINGYWKNDPRGFTNNLFFDEAFEDTNNNGVLDPGEDVNGNGVLDEGEDTDGDGVLDPPEDTDADGVLDVPNYLPRYLDASRRPALDDLGGRADALMTFYERETNTLIVRPMEPLRERTTYAVVVTRRLLDADGRQVGSPFDGIHHAAQIDALRPLSKVLPEGLKMDDVAFAFTFTTQSLESGWVALREGIYGHGVQAHLATEFPAEVKEFAILRDPEHPRHAGVKNPYIMPGETWIEAFRLVATSLLGQQDGSVEFADLLASQRNIDFFVIGRFESAQLYERTGHPDDAPSCELACERAANCAEAAAERDTYTACVTACAESGTPGQRYCLYRAPDCATVASCDADSDPWIGFNDQSWPPDLDRVPVKARSETVHFWLSVPRKEVSVRGEGKQPPVVIVGHGYGSNRFELAQFGGFFAEHGMAALAIDCPSHGIGIKPQDRMLADTVLGAFGLGKFIDAVFTDRAHDQNRDGAIDSGADFWTSYVFHTRDVVRQCGFDYMQLLRLFKSFDGQKRWAHDLNGDGTNELAGDFDADGIVDVGAESAYSMAGGSLGGIMAIIMASLEPHLVTAVPISGGGGLGDIGNRTLQGGVREAVILRAMGPLYLGTVVEDGTLVMETLVPDLNDDRTLTIGTYTGVKAGDTMVVENLVNGERGCGYVSAAGTVRAGVASDLGDETMVRFYAGPQLVTGDTHCTIIEGVEPVLEIDTFGVEVAFQGLTYLEGSPLTALAEGFGERRSSPGLRRFLGLAQLVLDPGDPASYARYMGRESLAYPALGDSTGTHTLVVTTTGDMNVPASSGLTVARAAGYIGHLVPDPRYGVPLNQQVLDTRMAEAVHTLGRYRDDAGNSVMLDVENFSQNNDLWTEQGIPRLEKPLRIGLDQRDAMGGYSGAIFPYTVPTGQHGFAFPGNEADQFVKRCKAACAEGVDCACDIAYEGHYDVGRFMFNMLGRYMSSGGLELTTDLCHGTNTCDYRHAAPEPRAAADLP